MREVHIRINEELLYEGRGYGLAPYGATFPVYFPIGFRQREALVNCEMFREFLDRVTGFLRASHSVSLAEEATVEVREDMFARQIVVIAVIGTDEEIRGLNRQWDRTGAYLCVNPNGQLQARDRGRIGSFVEDLRGRFGDSVSVRQQAIRERDEERQAWTPQFIEPEVIARAFEQAPDVTHPGESILDRVLRRLEEREEDIQGPPRPTEPAPKRKTIIRNLKVDQAAPPSTAPATPRRRMKLEGKS